jgi:hypothetical protein
VRWQRLTPLGSDSCGKACFQDFIGIKDDGTAGIVPNSLKGTLHEIATMKVRVGFAVTGAGFINGTAIVEEKGAGAALENHTAVTRRGVF